MATQDRDAIDLAVDVERDRIVATLRYLAERIEAAPRERFMECGAWIVGTVEPLTRTVERGLGR